MGHIRLGDAFAPPPSPSPEQTAQSQVLTAIERLRDAVLALPAPQVTVERVSDDEIAQIVQSVVALAGPHAPSTEELAAAVRDAVKLPEVRLPDFPEFPAPVDPSPALDRLADRFKALENTIRGLAAQSSKSYGSSGPSNIADNANRELGKVSVKGTVSTQEAQANAASAPATLTINTTAGEVLAANPDRRKLIIQNTHATANVFVGYGANPNSSTGLKIAPGGLFEELIFTGAIHALTDNGSAISVPYVEVGP